jgi:hypothetical protein
MKTNRTILLVAVLLLVMATTACSQIVFGQRPSTSPKFVYSHWTVKLNLDALNDLNGIPIELLQAFGDEVTVSQSYMPLAGYVPIRDNLEAQVFLATSTSSTEVSDLENSVSGLSDIRLQINQSLSNDRILISGGLNLPTGKTNLDLFEEGGVIEMLSQDFLEFPSRRLGEGFGFNLLVGGAAALGETRVGGGVMYRFNGSYTPYEIYGDYDPGDVFSVNVGADLPGGNVTWSTVVAYTLYTTDKQNGEDGFKQSPQLALSLSGLLKEGRHLKIKAWTSFVIRGNNTALIANEYTIQNQLPPFRVDLRLYGDEFTLGTAVTYSTAGDWHFMPSARIRLVTENEQFPGSSNIISLGAAIGKTVSDRLDASVGYRYFTGGAFGDRFDLTGHQLTLGLMATF